jgi:hypothetical protein
MYASPQGIVLAYIHVLCKANVVPLPALLTFVYIFASILFSSQRKEHVNNFLNPKYIFLTVAPFDPLITLASLWTSSPGAYSYTLRAPQNIIIVPHFPHLFPLSSAGVYNGQGEPWIGKPGDRGPWGQRTQTVRASAGRHTSKTASINSCNAS